MTHLQTLMRMRERESNHHTYSLGLGVAIGRKAQQGRARTYRYLQLRHCRCCKHKVNTTVKNGEHAVTITYPWKQRVQSALMKLISSQSIVTVCWTLSVAAEPTTALNVKR
jgi:hypothetical protein